MCVCVCVYVCVCMCVCIMNIQVTHEENTQRAFKYNAVKRTSQTMMAELIFSHLAFNWL